MARFDPSSPSQLGRLKKAVEWSRRKLKPFREHRSRVIRQYVGQHYTAAGSGDRVPVNVIEMAVNIFTQHLAARRPKVLALAGKPQFKPAAATLELAINRLMDEVRFGCSLRSVVRDAMFSVGIAKVGLNATGKFETGGVFHDVGQPFFDPVDLDDWVYDVTAKGFEHVQYAGNRYRLPLDVVRDDDRYDKKAREALVRSQRMALNEDGSRRVDSAAMNSGEEAEEYRDHVELWDIWLPMDGLVVTFSASKQGSEGFLATRPLQIIEWEGPENGPYHLLSFASVPGNVMPLAPSTIWIDLHELLNQIFTKVSRQALRQKDVVGYPGSAAADAERLKKSGDGDMISMTDPTRLREFSFGGVDRMSLAFAMQLRDIFSLMSGNLDVLGGLGAQSPTATQDQMLQSAASKRVQDMQDRLQEFASRTLRDLAWYLWTDPLIELPLIKRSGNLEIPVTFTPEQREGDFLDYEIQVEPYSMQPQTPSSRLQTAMSVFQQIIIPMAPMMAAEGITINFEGFLRLIAKYADMKELEEILTFMNPDSTAAGQADQGPVRPSETHRINERISRTGSSPQSNQSDLMRLLLSGNENNGSGNGRAT